MCARSGELADGVGGHDAAGVGGHGPLARRRAQRDGDGAQQHSLQPGVERPEHLEYGAAHLLRVRAHLHLHVPPACPALARSLALRATTLAPQVRLARPIHGGHCARPRGHGRHDLALPTAARQLPLIRHHRTES